MSSARENFKEVGGEMCMNAEGIRLVLREAVKDRYRLTDQDGIYAIYTGPVPTPLSNGYHLWEGFVGGELVVRVTMGSIPAGLYPNGSVQTTNGGSEWLGDATRKVYI